MFMFFILYIVKQNPSHTLTERPGTPPERCANKIAADSTRNYWNPTPWRELLQFYRNFCKMTKNINIWIGQMTKTYGLAKQQYTYGRGAPRVLFLTSLYGREAGMLVMNWSCAEEGP